MIYRVKTIDSRNEATLHIFDDTTAPQVLKQIGALVRQGQEVVFPNGVREWRDTEVEFNPSLEGSKAYTWDRGGNKVRHRVIRTRVLRDGTRDIQVLGTTWKAF